MYNEIEDLDLIAKEFKMHDHCRKTFLKGFGEKSREKCIWKDFRTLLRAILRR